MSGNASKETPAKPKGGKQRIHALDELRGFAVFCMVFYHGFYSIGYFFGWDWGIWLVNFFRPVEPLFAGLFILISGICSNLSHSNIERGAKLFFISYAVTVVTYFAVGSQSAIRFGILHMLSIAMMLFGVTAVVLRFVPLWVGIPLNVLLFLFTLSVSSGSVGIPYVWSLSLPAEWYQTDFLYPLGLHPKNFSSSDYFPLMPWLFLFFTGGFLGRLAAQKKFPKGMYKKHIGFFAVMGRHALLIYLVHQPVIFGLCQLMALLLPSR